MNQNISAPSAGQNPTTQKTDNTPGASGAAFLGHPTISSYIEEQFKIAGSEESSSVISTAERVANLGFTASANTRLAHFLGAYRQHQDLVELYGEKYPNSVFLPWSALHETIDVLDLWVELPKHYLGAVPGAQLPYLEMFELMSEDVPRDDDWFRCMNYEDDGGNDHYRDGFSLAGPLAAQSNADFAELTRWWEHNWRPLRSLSKQFRRSFFVVAPREAFNTEEDWLSRARKMTSEAADLVVHLPPDDPLVIRFVRGGALVVAAWGDEAQHINAMVRQITKIKT